MSKNINKEMAFPGIEDVPIKPGNIFPAQRKGLSKLEYFTAQAMMGIVTKGCDHNTVASQALQIAKKTLKLLERQEEDETNPYNHRR